MTDEAAGSPGPARTGAEPRPDTAPLHGYEPPPPPGDGPPTAHLGDRPPTAEVHGDPPPTVDPHGDPPSAPGSAPPRGAEPPPPPPPFGAGGPTAPPWYRTGAEDRMRFTREYLVRPTEGRYVAGVCAAFGRATNTDPVLWRVVIAVLGFFGGIGILIYLLGWLGIPAEGDTASPLESVLGRGRSQMSPISVLLLALAAALTFAFIVNDGFRAALLAGAVLLGGVLLLRRGGVVRPAPGTAPPTGSVPPPTPNAGFPWATPATAAPGAYAPEYPPAGASWTRTAPAGEPVTAPGNPPGSGGPPGTPFGAAPQSGYRPPFAPHGPWAGAPPYPPAFGPGPTRPQPPRPPKPPRERSKLGRITFFLIPVAVGLVGLLDLAGVQVVLSAYFAAALTTIALGLLVGTWFGRPRGLIALALVATVGLGVSSANERWGATLNEPHWRPTNIAGVADRYETRVADATLDLRNVDFAGQHQVTTVSMQGGRLQVMLPPAVDTVATVDLGHGRVRLFGAERSGRDIPRQTVTDLGTDGTGGGELRLNLVMEAGDVEVVR